MSVLLVFMLETVFMKATKVFLVFFFSLDISLLSVGMHFLCLLLTSCRGCIYSSTPVTWSNRNLSSFQPVFQFEPYSSLFEFPHKAETEKKVYKETWWKIFFSLFNTEQKFIMICPGIILKEKRCSCADRYNLDDAQFILNGRLHSFFILTLNHLIYFEITKQWSMDWGYQNWKKFNDMQVK